MTTDRLACTLMALLVAVATVHSGESAGLVDLGDGALHLWMNDAGFFLSAAVLVLRTPEGTARPPRLLLAASMVLWAAGNVTYDALSAGEAEVPVPSAADAVWFAFYVPAFAGVALLARRGFSRTSLGTRLDAVLAGAVVLALAADVVIEPVMAASEQLALATYLTGVAYPVLDVALLALAASGLALRGWQLQRGLVVVVLAVLAFYAGDSLFLVRTAAGTWTEQGVDHALYLWSAVGFAALAWLRVTVAEPREDSRRTVVAPVLLGLLGLGVLVVEALDAADPRTILLAAIAIVAVLLRAAAAVVEHHRLLRQARHEALTDALTGLGNRRRLLAELETAFASGRPHALVFLDLDGFKTYNDTYGHQAGDVLLQRIGQALVHAAGRDGTVHRSGGDEFFVLVDGADDVQARAELLAGAAVQRGDGFLITATFGWASLPAEACEPDQALHVADERMYRRKTSGRVTAGRQSTDVLVALLEEHSPGTAEHAASVAQLADATARELGLPEPVREEVRRVAALHDVGKLAMPSEVLDKPGALDDDDWAVMRTHTVVGERVLLSAPALSHTAKAVRSSHERWDGTGYPDGLVGEDIPIAARVCAVCDAYDAMVSERCYGDVLTPGGALAELRRCSGTQFDPAVVDAFTRVLTDRERAVLVAR
ncbi:HD domain-containing phosphohydrolase [Conexibacter sp. SYSU D00693]|uniref:bifunctional diguanylate cyclase/phosphohydrolase n=1 Tax=Conexibacter sp. SYSU D00693 TaxID=2812560 RepID=UPI00196B529B|nr:diguanylate cyclase [Conexibacter sp. SYSU D00693]